MNLTPKQYAAALQVIFPRLSDPQLRMLRAHFHAPLVTMTGQELALAAGFQNWKPVNMHYGLVGSYLRDAMGVVDDAIGQKSSIFVEFLPPSKVAPAWRWVMRNSFKQALLSLGWFEEDLLGVETKDIHFLEAFEGALVHKLTVHRQRESSLRAAKLLEARAAHPNGRLVCEVHGCGFDFEMVYGSIGSGYAEVHHLKPLSSYEDQTLTSLDDLAVVCSNCHRMIHRGGECRSLETLLSKS